MRFLHLSDLHIGKRVNEFSMIEDQEYILKQILDIIDKNGVEAVIIAGDVYDKPVPACEAVQLFDSFLTSLASRKLKTFVISGNHDAAERIAFASRLVCNSGIYLSPVFEGEIKPVTVSDSYGEVDVYMLPFIRPINVKRYYKDADITSYSDAVKTVIDNIQLNKERRNILIAHQLVTGAVRCESEDISVGGLDNVDATVFESFDYTALGHIHGPQKSGSEYIRYCGTPLKYSFSECNHKKSALIVDVLEKGRIEFERIPYEPLRDMREIKGTYLEITDKKNYDNTNVNDYLHVTLTDDEEVIEALGRLRTIYPNIMKLDYDNKRTRSNQTIEGSFEVNKKHPIEMLMEFFEKQNNQEMSEEQIEYSNKLINKIWEVER